MLEQIFQHVNLEQIIVAIVSVAALVPLLGGGAGAVVSAIVNMAKAAGLALAKFGVGKGIPDNWGGYLFTILNLVAFIVIAVCLGVNPADLGDIPELPGNTEEVLTVLASIITGVAFLIGQFVGGQKAHEVQKVALPRLVSTTERIRLGEQKVRYPV